MRWPWQTEKREQPSSDYSDQATASILRMAEGGYGGPESVSAVEVCLGLWSRALGSAEVSPSNELTGGVSPDLLATAARELGRTGNSLFYLQLVGSRIECLPIASYDVRGSHSPESWVYRIDLPGPSDYRTRLVPSGEVLHFRINQSASEPWRGRSPLSLSRSTARLAEKIEKSLTREQIFAPARMVFSDLLDEDLTNFITEVRRGGVVIVGGSDDQAGPTPSTRSPQALGPDPSISQISLRSEAAMSILSVFGVPPSLFGSSGDSDARESWRRFVLSTINPLARMCEAELRGKLDSPDLSLSLEDLRSGDLQGRGRATAARALAMRNLVTAGLSVEDAREAAGI